MKTIGLIGGMSWESTTTYYTVINEVIKKELGGLHSAKILLYSVDFDEIEKYQAENNWEMSAEVLKDIALKLQNAGADILLICTNTMHKVADEVQSAINIPLIHIADATAEELLRHNIIKVALLGTRYTMQQDFYKKRLEEKGIEVLIPSDDDVITVNDIIYNELCKGIINDASRQKYIEIIDKLTQRGAQGVILGCTEIGLLVKNSDTNAKLFDTTLIHAKKAAYTSIK